MSTEEALPEYVAHLRRIGRLVPARFSPPYLAAEHENEMGIEMHLQLATVRLLAEIAVALRGVEASIDMLNDTVSRRT